MSTPTAGSATDYRAQDCLERIPAALYPLRAPGQGRHLGNTYGPEARTPTGAPMFDVFESMSMWLNACARAAWLWSIELDRASAVFDVR
jgi:hypothetical protein